MHLESGENIKSIASKIHSISDLNIDYQGEVMSFWCKRMLPQVFKWSDEEKVMISGELDEGDSLKNAADFKKTELELESIEFETGDLDVGRSASAMPLAPTIVYQ